MKNVIQNHFLDNHLFQRDPEENTICSLIFQKTPIVMHANAQKSRELRAEKIQKFEMIDYFMRHNLGIRVQRA